ncbi:MAG: hypothetical protein WCJ02_01775 [bacterium]
MSRAMTLRHLQGQCVSCGRPSPWPHVESCPYCGEEVLMPRLWVILRRAWGAVFIVAMGMVVLLPMMQGKHVRSHGAWSIQSWILVSVASSLFLMPHTTQDVIVCSQRELLAWQIKSFLCALAIGVSSLICAAQIVYAHSDGLLTLFVAILTVCLLVSPWFFRLCSWRMWIGIFLIFASRVV